MLNEAGRSPLHVATALGAEPVVRALIDRGDLDRGADIHFGDKERGANR